MRQLLGSTLNKLNDIPNEASVFLTLAIIVFNSTSCTFNVCRNICLTMFSLTQHSLLVEIGFLTQYEGNTNCWRNILRKRLSLMLSDHDIPGSVFVSGPDFRITLPRQLYYKVRL